MRVPRKLMDWLLTVYLVLGIVIFILILASALYRLSNQ